MQFLLLECFDDFSRLEFYFRFEHINYDVGTQGVHPNDLLRQNIDFMKPFHEFEAPLRGFRRLALIHSIAMSSRIVEQKHMRDVLGGEGAVEVDGVLVHDDRVVDGRHQEGGGHIGRNLQLHGVLVL